MNIEAVTFDAGGTLIYPSRPVGTIYAEVSARMGIGLDPQRLENAFKKSFKSTAPVFVNGYALTSSSLEWWRRLVKTVLVESAQFAPFESARLFDAYFDAVYAEFLRANCWTVCPELMGIVSACRAQGIKTAVLSNWDSRLRPILDVLGLTPGFDQMIISCEAGMEKPEPEIFRIAAAALDVVPGKILHVGDSRREDYDGAVAAGMKAFLVESDRSNLRGLHNLLGL